MWVYMCTLVAARRKSRILLRDQLESSLRVCVCVSVCAHTREPFLLSPIFRKSAEASHCFGPQRMSSYCGFGAPEQLGEFMVSAKKRRSLSFCQSWFPSRSKCRPLWAAKGGHGSQPCLLSDVFEPCKRFSFYVLQLHFVAKQSEPKHACCIWCLAT